LDSFEATKLHCRLDEDVQSIVQHYAPAVISTLGVNTLSHNQICGAWVEVLPTLVRTRRSDQPLVTDVRHEFSAWPLPTFRLKQKC
jgi:hypothetical protein